MIPIEIDDKNIVFRDLHLKSIKGSIETIIKSKIRKKNSFEKEVLEWINDKLDDILIGNLLRNIITEFDTFIEKFNNISYLNKIVFNKVEIEKKSVDDLISILENNPFLKYEDLKPRKGKTWILKEQYLELIYYEIKKVKISDDLKYKVIKSRINILLKNIFEDFYERKWNKIKGYDRYDFVKKYNIYTCPYCNRNYIAIVDKDKDDKNGLRPEIEHFFPKSIYPYLAMSFYNLIPSCQVCNHTKSNKNTYNDKLLSPYEIDENTFQFTYGLNYINFLDKSSNTPNISVQFKNIDSKSEEYFKLETLYRGHQDIVLELLIKRTIYTKSYIKELKENFRFTNDEIYRFLLCNYNKNEDLHKRPLSKLIKDISTELGLINPQGTQK